MATVEETCSQLQQRLQNIAPHLRPLIAPRGYVLDSEDFLSLLLNLFAAEDHAKVTELILQSGKRINHCTFCKTPGFCVVDETEGNQSGTRFRFSTDWILDFHAKTFGLSRIVAVCPNCSELRDLNQFLEAALKLQSERVLQLVQHFLTANKCEPDADDVEGMRVFQECFSIAYSLKLIGSNLPKLIPTTPFDHSDDKLKTLQEFLLTSFPIDEYPHPSKKRKEEVQDKTEKKKSKGTAEKTEKSKPVQPQKPPQPVEKSPKPQQTKAAPTPKKKNK